VSESACETREEFLPIETPDGVMETFVVHPDDDGPYPVVAIYMDAPAIREELYEFARRIAGQGYYCALPDLYYRRGRIRFDVARMTADDRKEMLDHMNSLSNAMVIADTEALLGVLAAQGPAGDGPKGCIGYCMSGQFIMSVAGTFPEHFRASISCYGVSIVTDNADSPHNLVPNVKGEIFFAFAEKDEYVPDAAIEILRQTLDENQIDFQLDIYPDTEHGFCFPQRTGCYAEEAAEDVWKRSFEMFARQLA
jgi:carboxymethylenebutenolidase